MDPETIALVYINKVRESKTKDTQNTMVSKTFDKEKCDTINSELDMLGY